MSRAEGYIPTRPAPCLDADTCTPADCACIWHGMDAASQPAPAASRGCHDCGKPMDDLGSICRACMEQRR